MEIMSHLQHLLYKIYREVRTYCTFHKCKYSFSMWKELMILTKSCKLLLFSCTNQPYQSFRLISMILCMLFRYLLILYIHVLIYMLTVYILSVATNTFKENQIFSSIRLQQISLIIISAPTSTSSFCVLRLQPLKSIPMRSQL